LEADRLIRPEIALKRKAVSDLMIEVKPQLAPYVNNCELPFWLVPRIQKLGINGLFIKDFGGPGMNNLEAGVILYEFAKHDASIATFVQVHNSIGTYVIDQCGNEEQRSRLLKETINMDKIVCFGLTEPLNGSDASGL
jgi:alkylation response protein AidB-like acyl-CoA dehydrogenase